MEVDLTRLPVAVIDCQTTGAAPDKGFLLEVAWTILSPVNRPEKFKPEVHSFLITLPDGGTIPDRITRMTGISSKMAGEGLEECELAKLLLPVLRNVIMIAHFAVFEQRWIDNLLSRCLPDEKRPRIICTREIARRVYPRLPRKGIRAVAGYLGFSMDEKKRAAGHVRATALIWSKLILELRKMGILNLSQLRQFLAEPPAGSGGGWHYALPRETRLSLPDAPGVYHLLSTNGEVLYVGKASSLRRRVNSYFTRRKADEKTLELVSQVHDVSIEECETPLEAALLEFDTIRKLQPPYNRVMKRGSHRVVYLSKDLSSNSLLPGNDHTRGPVPESSSALLFHEILTVMNGRGTITPDKFGLGYLSSDVEVLEPGFELFRDENFGASPVSAGDFLRAGLNAWFRLNEDSEDLTDDDDEETSGFTDTISVSKHFEWLLSSGARDLRAGAWFCLLGWSSLLWKPVLSEQYRHVSFRAGEMVSSEWIPGNRPQITSSETRIKRQSMFSALSYDRVKVLNSELKRITATGGSVNIRVPGGQLLGRESLLDLYRYI